MKSKGNLETLNIMEPTGSPGQYIYHLDTTGYSIGDKIVCIWGTAWHPYHQQPQDREIEVRSVEPIP